MADAAPAPPPAVVADGTLAVPIDITALEAAFTFDCRHQRASATAELTFHAGEADGWGLFDLRQPIIEAALDGEPITPSDLAPVDLGAGPGATMRAIRRVLASGSEHRLRLRYDLGLPDTTEPLPVGWVLRRPGVVFDLWMSDLYPGRYLEQWLPASLLHDRFDLSLDIHVEGAEPHAAITNATVAGEGSDHLRLRWPDSTTAISPMLVLAPESRLDRFAEVTDGVRIDVSTLAGPEVDLMRNADDLGRWFADNRARFGPYAFGDRFTSFVWATTRGMEYDGATTASLGSLEHEAFHAWFGRGVKPAHASDGWIDEAITTYCTAGSPRQRLWSESFDPSAAPLLLRPAHPYSRHTPREAYGDGARLFAGFADLLGTDGLLDTLGEFYAARIGGFASTADLQAHLSEAAGRDLTPIFARWVHGQDEPV